MVRLRCNCLNVSVETVGSSLREVDGNSFVSEKCADSFFCEKLYEVQLAVGGVRKEQEILIRKRYVGDWIVFKCLGCDSEPLAQHSVKTNERVLVNQSIQNDPKKITQLVESENLSPAFRVVLNSTSEEDVNAVNSYSNESISAAGVCVQEQVKRYLKAEQEAMEERIKSYAEKQRNLFAMVQSRAYNDKRTMLSILRKAAESKVEESLSEAIADVLETDGEGVHEEALFSPAGYEIHNLTNIRILLPPDSGLHQNKNDNTHDLNSDHFDPLFAVQGDCQPFAESDEEESSDNSFNQNEEYEKARYKERYSSSVPVNVPLLHSSRYRKRERIGDEDDSEEVPSPDKMAESIKALARSVRDSREIFGELPRPRLNTLPLPLT